MTAYATLAALKASAGISSSDTSQDTALGAVLEQMARWLDGQCERDFLRHPTSAQDDDETRIVRTNGRRRALAFRSGIISLTSLEVSDSPSGTFSTVDADEYTFAPYELPPEETYEQLVRIDGQRWDAGFYRATGHFGFATVPSMIVDANLDGARELFRQGPGGGAPVGVNQFGTPLFANGMPKTVSDALWKYAWKHRHLG